MGVCYVNVYDNEKLSSFDSEFLAIIGTDTVVHKVAIDLGVVPIDTYVDYVADNENRTYHNPTDALGSVEQILKTCFSLPEERFAADGGKERVLMELEGLKSVICTAADADAGFALAMFL